MDWNIMNGGAGTMLVVVLIIIIFLAVTGKIGKKEGIDVRSQANQLSAGYDTQARVLGRGWTAR